MAFLPQTPEEAGLIEVPTGTFTHTLTDNMIPAFNHVTTSWQIPSDISTSIISAPNRYSVSFPGPSQAGEEPFGFISIYGAMEFPVYEEVDEEQLHNMELLLGWKWKYNEAYKPK